MSEADKRKADVFEVECVLLTKLKLNVDGDGNVVAGSLDQSQLGGLTGVTSPRAAEWMRANAPVAVAWCAKLIVASIEQASKEYRDRGVTVPKEETKA